MSGKVIEMLAKWRPLAVMLLVLYSIPAASHAQGTSPSDDCYTKIAPLLKDSNGELTPALRSAYLNWAEASVMHQLAQASQPIPQDCLAEIHHDTTLRDAMFAAVFPPDPSILQNYAHLRAALGWQFVRKYPSLVIAVAVARRTKGVESGDDKNFGATYQPDFWTDESLQAVGPDEKDFIAAIAGFMKTNGVAGIDLYQSADRQHELVDYLNEHHVDSKWIATVQQSVDFGEKLKNAMVLLGQRPAASDPKPDIITWLRYLASIYEAQGISSPTVNGQLISWPLFPIDKAPWPLLMSLSHQIPLSEAKYILENFQGLHGPDRYLTYGPYRDDATVMPYELQPSRWFWDAWPDRMFHGGECVPLSEATVEFYTALAKPAMWAGQPGHANLISFSYINGQWTADIEQAFAGGPDVTFAQWYFNEDVGSQLRFRDSFYWAGAEYDLGLPLAMNVGLRPYMDTRIAANIFRTLPPAEKPTVGVRLLTRALQTNPFNPELWYRVAQSTLDEGRDLTLTKSAIVHGLSTSAGQPMGNTASQYWQTVAEFLADYVIDRATPHEEEGLHNIYGFLAGIQGISGDQLSTFLNRSVQKGRLESSGAVETDQQLADSGDEFGLLRMGQRYLDGDGVQKNRDSAIASLEQSANRGDAVASLELLRLNPPIPAALITVTGSSSYGSDQKPAHLVDGSGMTGIFHDNNGMAATMWHTTEKPTPASPAPNLPASPAWVKFDFAQPMKFDAIQIWNHNQANGTDRCFRMTHIYATSDGNDWFPITAPPVIDLPRSKGDMLETPTTIANRAARQPITSVIIAADAINGNYGAGIYGLAAVRFVATPPQTIPADVIAITVSSIFSGQQVPIHLIDGSGMSGEFHDNDAFANTMWQASENPTNNPPAPGLSPSPAWARFDFKTPQRFSAIEIWNQNQANLTDRSFRKTHIYGTTDGDSWFPLTSPASIEIPRATGAAYVAPDTIPNSQANRLIKSVIIAADSIDGNYGSTCYGLSAVRFITEPLPTPR